MMWRLHGDERNCELYKQTQPWETPLVGAVIGVTLRTWPAGTRKSRIGLGRSPRQGVG